jgi:large subunit ribosomal protein L21
VHNAAAGIEYPVQSSEFFCVAEVDGFQYKLMEDCRITLDNKPDMQLNQQVIWDKVLLVASKDFTLLGRPFVNGATIEATVEEKLRASKIIVFKKKRRKQYKRSHGFRAKLTVLRINKIHYSLTEKELTRAVNLE